MHDLGGVFLEALIFATGLAGQAGKGERLPDDHFHLGASQPPQFTQNLLDADNPYEQQRPPPPGKRCRRLQRVPLA